MKTRLNLRKLHAAVLKADAELIRLRSAWVDFGMKHGEAGKDAARLPGNPGHELLKALRAARANRDIAATGLSAARLMA